MTFFQNLKHVLKGDTNFSNRFWGEFVHFFCRFHFIINCLIKFYDALKKLNARVLKKLKIFYYLDEFKKNC